MNVVMRKTRSALARRRAVAGFIDGLTSASALIAGTLPRPPHHTTTMKSDWIVVGNDIARAIQSYGQIRKK